MSSQKPSKNDLQNAISKKVPDIIAPHLTILFCGINPGLYTAWSGHHFGRPGNRFWKTLYNAGFTDRLFHPSEQLEMLKLGYGITNVVERASATAAELTSEELIDGGNILTEKVIMYKPRYLAILGVQAYRKAFGRPKAKIGKQAEMIGDTIIWVLPNPSGLNAHYQLDGLMNVFAELKKESSL